MRNISDTEAYTVFDHVFSKTVRSLSAVLGLKKITQPFWNRWLASGVEPDAIFEFLDGVGTIDNWATTAERVFERKARAFEESRSELPAEACVAALRQLSYLAHMGQWGCLPLNDQRRALYTLARDYYVEAEHAAFGSRYARIEIPWRGSRLFGNLHVADPPARLPAPLVLIVHGIDGCKEEHLATELALIEAGFSTLCFDGPGQGEALLLSGIKWDADFHRAISAGIDAASAHAGVDASRVGVLGISIGGMWALQAAAGDSRIGAVFDLGGPIHTRKFASLPFLIKTRLCQVTGARTTVEVARVLGQNNIESPELLASIGAHVRMLHGGRDRVVSTDDKSWLLAQFEAAPHRRDVSLRIIEDGDHCCTGHFGAVRSDVVAFFSRCFPPA